MVGAEVSQKTHTAINALDTTLQKTPNYVSVEYRNQFVAAQREVRAIQTRQSYLPRVPTWYQSNMERARQNLAAAKSNPRYANHYYRLYYRYVRSANYFLSLAGVSDVSQLNGHGAKLQSQLSQKRAQVAEMQAKVTLFNADKARATREIYQRYAGWHLKAYNFFRAEPQKIADDKAFARNAEVLAAKVSESIRQKEAAKKAKFTSVLQNVFRNFSMPELTNLLAGKFVAKDPPAYNAATVGETAQKDFQTLLQNVPASDAELATIRQKLSLHGGRASTILNTAYYPYRRSLQSLWSNRQTWTETWVKQFRGGSYAGYIGYLWAIEKERRTLQKTLDESAAAKAKLAELFGTGATDTGDASSETPETLSASPTTSSTASRTEIFTAVQRAQAEFLAGLEPGGQGSSESSGTPEDSSMSANTLHGFLTGTLIKQIDPSARVSVLQQLREAGKKKLEAAKKVALDKISASLIHDYNAGMRYITSRYYYSSYVAYYSGQLRNRLSDEAKQRVTALEKSHQTDLEQLSVLDDPIALAQKEAQANAVAASRRKFQLEFAETLDQTTPLEDLFPPMAETGIPEGTLNQAMSTFQTAGERTKTLGTQVTRLEQSLSSYQSSIRSLQNHPALGTVRSYDRAIAYFQRMIDYYQKKGHPVPRYYSYYLTYYRNYRNNYYHRYAQGIYQQLANAKHQIQNLPDQIDQKKTELADQTSALSAAEKVLKQDPVYYEKVLLAGRQKKFQALAVEMQAQIGAKTRFYRPYFSSWNYWARRRAYAEYSSSIQNIRIQNQKKLQAVNETFQTLLAPVRQAVQKQKEVREKFERHRQQKIADYARKRAEWPFKNRVVGFLQDLQTAGQKSVYLQNALQKLTNTFAYDTSIKSLSAEMKTPSANQAEIDELYKNLAQSNGISWEEHLAGNSQLRSFYTGWRAQYLWSAKDAWSRERQRVGRSSNRWWNQKYGEYSRSLAASKIGYSDSVAATLKTLATNAHNETMASYGGWQKYYHEHPVTWQAKTTEWKKRLAQLLKAEKEQKTELSSQMTALTDRRKSIVDQVWDVKEWIEKTPEERQTDSLTDQIIDAEVDEGTMDSAKDVSLWVGALAEKRTLANQARQQNLASYKAVSRNAFAFDAEKAIAGAVRTLKYYSTPEWKAELDRRNNNLATTSGNYSARNGSYGEQLAAQSRQVASSSPGPKTFLASNPDGVRVSSLNANQKLVYDSLKVNGIAGNSLRNAVAKAISAPSRVILASFGIDLKPKVVLANIKKPNQTRSNVLAGDAYSRSCSGYNPTSSRTGGLGSRVFAG